MPDNKNNLNLEAIMAEIQEKIEKYLQEIEQQVQEGKDRTYEGWENIPQQNTVETQPITEPEKQRALGVFHAPVRNKKPKKVDSGGEI